MYAVEAAKECRLACVNSGEGMSLRSEELERDRVAWVIDAKSPQILVHESSEAFRR